ncbi:MAG: hypothetical protein WAT19_02205 [Ferruginibacter sp.]
MKKFLVIAVIAASFVACNEGEKKETAAPAATETPATPAADTTAPKTDTAAPVAKDTVAAPVADTTKK